MFSTTLTNLIATTPSSTGLSNILVTVVLLILIGLGLWSIERAA